MTVVHGLPKSESSLFHLFVKVNSSPPLPLIHIGLVFLLCSDSNLTDSLRPREYLSNVKLSGLVVDVASVASLVLSQVRRGLQGGGTTLQLSPVVFVEGQLTRTQYHIYKDHPNRYPKTEVVFQRLIQNNKINSIGMILINVILCSDQLTLCEDDW